MISGERSGFIVVVPRLARHLYTDNDAYDLQLHIADNA